MKESLARKLLPHVPAYVGVDPDTKQAISKEFEKKHDKVALRIRILQWVGEA